jgi:hypothetical protein
MECDLLALGSFSTGKLDQQIFSKPLFFIQSSLGADFKRTCQHTTLAPFFKKKQQLIFPP